MTQHIPISNIEEQVIAAMFAAGIAPPQEGLLIDAHLHRFHLDGDKPGSKNGAYCIYPEGQSYNGWSRFRKPCVKRRWSWRENISRRESFS